jgi:hypothetical protein
MLHQATRKGKWPSSKATKGNVKFVYNGLYAAWVLADEIRSAGGQDTITYSHVFDHFCHVTHPEHWPSVTAITGSALARLEGFGLPDRRTA